MRRRALDAAGALRPTPPATALPAGAAGFDLYAGFWLRWAAEMLDNLIFLIPSLILLAILDNPVSLALTNVLWISYKIRLEAQGATLGKRAVRIRVVDGHGGMPGLQRSVMRNAFYIAAIVADVRMGLLGLSYLSTAVLIFLLVDALWMNRDERWQTLHDRFAGTYVVRDRGGL